jgi:hypothetical protein
MMMFKFFIKELLPGGAAVACSELLSGSTALLRVDALVSRRNTVKLPDCCLLFILGHGFKGEAVLTEISTADSGFARHTQRQMHRRLALMANLAKHIIPDNDRTERSGGKRRSDCSETVKEPGA